jgi:hypothetical protein
MSIAFAWQQWLRERGSILRTLAVFLLFGFLILCMEISHSLLGHIWKRKNKQHFVQNNEP